MNIYVGNLAYAVGEQHLEREFSAFGGVKSAQVVRDNETGRSRGFGFVEMEDADAGRKAIEELNGVELEGRAIVVNEARPRERRDGPPRGDRNGGGFRSDRGDRGPRRDFNGGGDRGGFRGNGRGGR